MNIGKGDSDEHFYSSRVATFTLAIDAGRLKVVVLNIEGNTPADIQASLLKSFR